jgi:hypothetical protein
VSFTGFVAQRTRRPRWCPLTADVT